MTASRIMGIDPGDKRIGVAISDATATLARPLTMINSTSRHADALAIMQLAEENDVDRIVVGQSSDDEGKPNYQGRRAARLAGELSTVSRLEVILWDESFSTSDANEVLIKMGIPPAKRNEHIDEAAASMILQSFLDVQKTSST